MMYGPDEKTRKREQTEQEGKRSGLPHHDSPAVACSQDMHMSARKAKVP